jgi:outer membrane lipoprotein-sorting protein
MMKRYRWLSLFPALALALGFAAPASAASAAATSAQILSGIAARNPSLQSFQARVHVNVHMLTFPWLSPQLDGTSYFKRPDSYEVVFDRVPSYAHGINKLFGDIDDVAAWEKDSNIAYAGTQQVNGRAMYALRMTKKIYSDQIADTVAYVDPSTYQVVRMDWHYRNGGTITMTQTYRQQGAYSVVATQHADIHIPHVHAVADATFGEYQANVAVNDAVFTGK